jgi:hypothetical protein
MAQRLQEELYQGSSSAGPAAHDDVRAPIARTTETLVAPDPAWDGAVDDETTQRFLEQLRSRRHPPRKCHVAHESVCLAFGNPVTPLK